MFFLFGSPIRARECDMENNQKIEKCTFSNFTKDILIIFLHNRFYPDVEFYG